MKTSASKKAASNQSGNSKKNQKNAAPAAPAQPSVATTPAPAPVSTAPVSTKLVGERLVGQTRDGMIDVVVRRRQLKTESKVALIKRLLMTEGQTKESILAAALPLHNGSDKALVNTINTVRADLKRALGGLVVAKGWKTDAKEGKLATAAVAKLRTHEVGVSAFSAAVEAVPLKPKATPAPAAQTAPAPAEEAKPEAKPAKK